jgi:hypothetical protein
MKNLKANQRDLVVMEFGILIQPFEALGSLTDPPSMTDYRRAAAKVKAGDSLWRGTARKFVTFAPDVVFEGEYHNISHVPESLLRKVKELIDDPPSGDLEEAHERFKSYVESTWRSSPQAWSPP